MISKTLSRRKWAVAFDYDEADVTPEECSQLELYYHVEAVSKLLANHPSHRVAGDMSRHVITIRRLVITALRNLDRAPLDQLAEAVDAVKYVATRTPEDEQMLLAIVKAAKAQNGVPYRSELQPYLSEKDKYLTPQALGERLESLGFGWLPGGHPRKRYPRGRKQG